MKKPCFEKAALDFPLKLARFSFAGMLAPDFGGSEMPCRKRLEVRDIVAVRDPLGWTIESGSVADLCIVKVRRNRKTEIVG